MTTASLDARREQRPGGTLGVGLPRGDLTLLEVADGDRRVTDGVAHLPAGLVRVAPEDGPVVEVEDGERRPASLLPGGAVRRAARLLTQSGHG